MISKVKLLCVVLLAVFLLFGCASMTPRYKLSDELIDYDEENSALLQIPNNVELWSIDDKDINFSVKFNFASQSVVQHAFRETLVPTGVHYLLYKNPKMPGKVSGQMVIRTVQEGFFATAIDFKKGYTYRLQSQVINEQGQYQFYGWVEELPFMLERKNIKPGLNFDKQFEYWYNQDWKVAGVGLDTVKLLNIEPEMRMDFVRVGSIELIDELKSKFTHLK